MSRDSSPPLATCASGRASMPGLSCTTNVTTSAPVEVTEAASPISTVSLPWGMPSPGSSSSTALASRCAAFFRLLVSARAAVASRPSACSRCSASAPDRDRPCRASPTPPGPAPRSCARPMAGPYFCAGGTAVPPALDLLEPGRDRRPVRGYSRTASASSARLRERRPADRATPPTARIERSSCVSVPVARAAHRIPLRRRAFTQPLGHLRGRLRRVPAAGPRPRASRPPRAWAGAVTSLTTCRR